LYIVCLKNKQASEGLSNRMSQWEVDQGSESVSEWSSQWISERVNVWAGYWMTEWVGFIPLWNIIESIMQCVFN